MLQRDGPGSTDGVCSPDSSDCTTPTPRRANTIGKMSGPGALRWDVAGWFNGTEGTFELVIDPATNRILHFLFTREGWMTTMESARFEILSSPSPVRGHPRYVAEDYAFCFRMDLDELERKGNQGTTSFEVDTLQLEVAVDSSLCLYIWGYCPMGGWKRSSLSPPVAHRGALRATDDEALVSGVSIKLDAMMPANA